MSVLADAGGEHLTRSAGGLLSLTTDFTILFWSRPVGAIPGVPGAYRTLWETSNLAGTIYFGVYQGDTGVIDLYVEIPGDFIDLVYTGDGVANFNQDYPIAVVYGASTKTFTLYVKDEVVGSGVLDISAGTLYDEHAISGTWSNTTITALREYQRALTFDEIKLEWSEFTAVDTTDLFLDCPFTADLDDVSGHGRDFTAVLTPTVVQGGPLNQYAYTPRVITSLPYTVSQTAYQAIEASFAYDVWFRHTASGSNLMLGVFGKGDPFVASGTSGYQPRLRVFRPDATTVFATNLADAENLPIQIPVTDGETYWFRFTPETPANTPAVLDVSVLRHLDQPVPRGAIMVTDDAEYTLPGGGSQEIPLCAFSAVDGANNQTLRFIGNEGITFGEYIDVLDDGTYAIAAANTGFWIYSNQFAPLVFCPLTFTTGSSSHHFIVRAARGVEKFYYAARNSDLGQLTIASFSKTGVAGPTWNVGNFTALGGAVNDAGTIFYWANATGNTIRAWDLVNDVSLGVIATTAIAPQRMFVLADDTILVYAQSGSSFADKYVYRYSAAGALLNTYTFDGAVYSINDPRIAVALDNPASFWLSLKRQSPDNGVTDFLNVRISDGAILATVRQPTYEIGLWNQTRTATPAARFGPSLSCDFAIMRVAYPETAPGTIVVEKVVVPSIDATPFDFTASGLTPTSFTLQHGGSQVFPLVAAGSGYGIAETPNALYTTEVAVSNDSPADNLVVAAGETVTVTVTNTAISPVGPPGCPNAADHFEGD